MTNPDTLNRKAFYELVEMVKVAIPQEAINVCIEPIDGYTEYRMEIFGIRVRFIPKFRDGFINSSTKVSYFMMSGNASPTVMIKQGEERKGLKLAYTIINELYFRNYKTGGWIKAIDNK